MDVMQPVELAEIEFESWQVPKFSAHQVSDTRSRIKNGLNEDVSSFQKDSVKRKALLGILMDVIQAVVKTEIEMQF